MGAVFLYGFVALIFGVPFAYFAFRALQRWKRGDALFSTRDYARLTGRGGVVIIGAIAANRWGALAAALLLVGGVGWMWYVDWRSTKPSP
jgi:hypothetical protein